MLLYVNRLGGRFSLCLFVDDVDNEPPVLMESHNILLNLQELEEQNAQHGMSRLKYSTSKCTLRSFLCKLSFILVFLLSSLSLGVQGEHF